ncbi:ImmA/IrrE family metallo-endopeptidase [Limosilactobacillus caecicola]|uniref:ImmA/IrrE family metallo-endopeptidase n=1 Tax=Limosilactobacillus caecicola TaxID=2941332 RepID=UPI00203D8FEA|nr:ImmA/IrrE family metallo-endopeptidase [Limosilactobacillus caecicola]
MNDLMEWLTNYAFDHDVGVILTRKLARDTPSISDGDHRLVIINMNWLHPHEVPFSFAHEIGHVLNGDKGIHEYSASSVGVKEEYQANLTGIKLLVDYTKNDNVDLNNPIRFCEQFGIPEELEYLVALKLRK